MADAHVHIRGYRAVTVLGQGSGATVFLAEQRALRRPVALKVLAARGSGAARRRARFEREARIAASLHHRHIVTVHDSGRCGHEAYIAFEYLPLGPASTLSGTAGLDQALRCVCDIGSALDYAHTQGLVHGDVKPANILRHEDGSFVLCDFGAARPFSGAAWPRCGSPAYAAPELWQGATGSLRTDLYALGVVLFELLSGQLPFVATTQAACASLHTHAALPRLQGEGERIQGLLARLLAKQPDERFSSGAELRAHVAALRQDGIAGEQRAHRDARDAHWLYEWPIAPVTHPTL